MKTSSAKPQQTSSEFDRADELLKIAQLVPPATKVKLGPYHTVIRELLRKEYTYAGIAEFMTKHLGRNVSRSQVFGFVKRNPGIFDKGVVAKLHERAVNFGVSVKEADEPKAPGEIFETKPLIRAPSFLKKLPPGLYLGHQGKIFRLEKQADGYVRGALAKKVPKKWVKDLAGHEPQMFFLGIYRGYSAETVSTGKA